MNFKESDLMPLYKEMAEIIGVEQTLKIYFRSVFIILSL